MTLVVDNSAPAAPSFRRSYRKTTSRRYGRYRRRYGGYRRYRRRTTRRRRTRFSVAELHQMSRFVRAQIDPFDPSVCGAKIPDSNTYPSTPLRIDDTLTAGCDANGQQVHCFQPHLKNYMVNGVGATSTTWTWAAAFGNAVDSSKQAAVSAAYTLFRPVAHGVRISCPYAPTSITGNVHVAIVTASNFGNTTWTFPTSIASMANSMFYKKYPLAQLTQQPVTIVNKFMDCTASKYIDPASSVGDGTGTNVSFQTDGWAAILVTVEGAPANSSCLTIDNCLHVEAIPKDTAIDTSSPAAPFNIQEQQFVSRMAGEIPGAFSEGDRPSYLQDVIGAIEQGFTGAGRHMFYNRFLPGVSRMAFAGAYYAANRYGLPGITNFRNPSPFQS